MPCEFCGQPLTMTTCGGCGESIESETHSDEIIGTYYHKECCPPPEPGRIVVTDNQVIYRRCPDVLDAEILEC